MNASGNTLKVEIERRSRQFESCFAAGDVNGLIDVYYDEKPLVSAPDMPLLEGRAALQPVFEHLRKAYSRVSLNLVRLEDGSDFAYELGNAVFNGTGQEDLAIRYIVVWRFRMGQWRVETDFFAPGKIY